MSQIARAFFLLVLFAFPVGVASAACTWTWDCSGGNGQCRHIPVCGSSLDMPPPPTPGVPPIAQPSVRPVPMPLVPPVGTSSCAPRYLCNGANQCSWQTICR